MKLRDIQLINSGKHSPERLEQNKHLMFYWENIRNILCMNLPDDLEFLGVSKLNIKLCESGGGNFIEPDDRGIAEYTKDGFTFEKFQELSDDEKDNTSLEYINNSLSEICDLYNVYDSTKQILREAINSVRESNFESVRIHKKTTKWDKSRKKRSVTKLYFKKGGVDAILEIVSKNGDLISKHTLTESGMWEFIWSDLWKGTWKDDTFVIERRFGDKFIEVQCSI